MVQRYLATSTNVQSRDKAASCLSQPTSRLPSQMSSMYGQSTTSTTPCMFSYAWHIIGYDWLSRFKKKRSLISEFKSTNDCRPEEGREGGQEGPLSLCLDEVKVRRGGGTHTHKWRRVTQCFANVHARHTHTRARAHKWGLSTSAHTHTLVRKHLCLMPKASESFFRGERLSHMMGATLLAGQCDRVWERKRVRKR